MPESEKISHVVARAIVRDAAERGLCPGTTLPSEGEMTARYGVSRGSLREALRILEALGFLTLKRGPAGGPVIQHADVHQFSSTATLHYQRMGIKYRELLEMREILEPAAARLCAERATEDDLAALRTYLVEAEQADIYEDRAFRVVGHNFHRMIADMSGRKLLELAILSCDEIFASRASSRIYPSHMRDRVVSAHNAVARAVLDRDAERATHEMAEHMHDFVAQASRQFLGIVDEPILW